MVRVHKTLRWLLTGDLRGPASARVAKNAPPGPQTRGGTAVPNGIFDTGGYTSGGGSPKL